MNEISSKRSLLKLANRIKSLRRLNAVSQEDAYNDTGIHFGRIEQGNRDVSYFTLVRISIYFDLTLEEFFSEGFN
ncbi:MAG: helix-turn-helix transcriptional regulator [Flavobacteriaceae bacterium]